MRILVDGWELQAGGRRRGIGRFLDGLLPTVAARPDADVTVLVPTSERSISCPGGVRSIPVRRAAPRGRIRMGTVEHVLRLPVDLQRVPHDVYLSPGTMPPLRSPRPWVQTLHDLAPLVLDHPAYRFHRPQWRLLGPRLRRAAAVVAVSRFAADEGIRVLDLDPARVEVVHHGVGQEFRPDGPVVSGPPYIATVVTADPRKGIDEAREVAVRVAALGRSEPLRIAGPLPAVDRRRLDSFGPVETVGFVDDLPAFLRGATAVIVTSRYEGFGFAALEAMACGAPVVAFDNTAIGEVVGDGGILVPDGDTEAMAREVDRLLGSEEAAREWRERGLLRARAFRWEEAARRYAEVFEAAVGT